MNTDGEAGRMLLDHVPECTGYIDRMHWIGGRVSVDGVDQPSRGNNTASTKSRGEITENSDGGFSRKGDHP